MWDSSGKIDTYTLFSKASRLAPKRSLNPSTHWFRLKCRRFVKSLLTSIWTLLTETDCAIQTLRRSSQVVVIIIFMTVIQRAATKCRKRQTCLVE